MTTIAVDWTNLPNLSVKELLAVVAVAESGRYTTASRLLKVSLPTLSRTVKWVEQSVGVTLFERTTRNVQITPAGRALVAVAQRVLGDLQFSLQDLGEVAAEQRGQVVVSAFPMFAHEMLPPIFREYLRTRPDIHLQVREGNSPEVLEQVLNGHSDFGLTYVDTLPDTVHRVTIRREPMYVIIPHDHPLGHSKEAHMTLSELQGTPLISLPPESYTRRVLDGNAASAGLWLKHAVVVPSFLDILNQVSAGVGVGIVPSGVISDRFLARLKARPLHKPSLSMTVGLIALRARHVTPAASGLMRLLLDSVKAQQTALRTEFLASSVSAFEDLPHGPYELLWRPASAPADPTPSRSESSVRDSNTSNPRARGRAKRRRTSRR